MSEQALYYAARRFQSFFFRDDLAAEENKMEQSLANHVMEKFGDKDGKYATNISLASHVFNATLIGLNTFIYDTVAVKGNDIEDIEPADIRLLIAALTLHDVNKYLDRENNTREVLEEYFKEKDDPLEISEYLGERKIDELLWLIQRTEVHEDSTESRGSPPQNRNLKRYCRIGDAAASRITKDGLVAGEEYLSNEYAFTEDHTVYLASFTALEQPILNDVVLSSVKEILQSEEAVILGTTPDTVLYLSEDQLDFDCDRLIEIAEQKLGEFDFGPKAGWNSFSYDILEEVEMPLPEKKSKIADEYVDLLESGTGGIEAHESISEGFTDHLPYLVKALYVDKVEEFGNDAAQALYDNIYDEVGGQKVKIFFLSELAQNIEEYRTFLEQTKAEYEEELQEDLTPDSNALNRAVDRFTGKDHNRSAAPTKENCFLCGQAAERVYQKGNKAFFNTQAYSRRTPPLEQGQYKQICGLCNLEHELLREYCNQQGVSLSNDVEVSYFYYDDFVADVSLFETLTGGEGMLDSPQISTALLSHQYHLQPFAVYNRNHRMRRIHRIIELMQSTGMKARIGKPFTRFEAAEDVFFDEEALRQQVLFDAERIESFTGLHRPLHLFDLIEKVGVVGGISNPYLDLDADTLPALAYFVSTNDDDNKLGKTLIEYLNTYHGDEFMQMQEIAQHGLDLFGKQFSSKHKKTKIFRTALDAFITAKSQGMDEEQIDEYVTGQIYNAAQHEQWAGKVTADQVNTFTGALKQYLEENDLYDLKKLSDWENALTNTYLYAFDNLLYGDKDDN